MMISANDVLQIISEIHQYSMLIVETKDATTFGILRSRDDKLSYFKLSRPLTHKERIGLIQNISSGKMSESVQLIEVEEFLRDIEGKKTRHIWLETAAPDRRELAFLSISELKVFFRNHSRR